MFPSLDAKLKRFEELELQLQDPEIISDIEWSTDAVAFQTLSKAEAINLSTTTIETLHDIDYHEDWLAHGLEKE